MKANHSSNMIRPKRRLQDYFDPSHGFVTPNQRSLPKYRNIFDHPKGKSLKKEQAPKRLSQGRVPVRREKENYSPAKPMRSGQKISRYEQSMGRDYDSPSKDH